MKLDLRSGSRVWTVRWRREGRRVEAAVDERTLECEVADAPRGFQFRSGERVLSAVVVPADGGFFVSVGGESYRFFLDAGRRDDTTTRRSSPHVVAPMPGKVTHVAVRPGQRVLAGETLVTLEAMKMETRLCAEAPGVVREVRVGEGAMVEAGEVLVVLEYEGEPDSARDDEA